MLPKQQDYMHKLEYKKIKAFFRPKKKQKIIKLIIKPYYTKIEYKALPECHVINFMDYLICNFVSMYAKRRKEKKWNERYTAKND